MSQKVTTRKTTVNEDKDKSKADSPVKEMKKKMAANAEKEKQAAEKTDKAEKSSEKVSEKPADKSDKSEKADKSVDKKSEKKDNPEKKSDKPEPQAEKSKGESSKEEKAGKSDKEKAEPKKVEQSKPKLNGKERVHNGVSDVTLGNGMGDALNGTVSVDSEDDDVILVIDDNDHDELFPELKYDDTSDMECSEPPTPENVPSRSFTRRSQVKATRTPETPRPASDKQTDGTDEPKDSKLLKLKEDIPTTDRKLRSADSPKPQENRKHDSENKQDGEKNEDTDNKQDGETQQETDSKKESDKKPDSGKKAKDDKEKDAENKDVKIAEEKIPDERIEIDIVVDVEANDGDEVQRKTDTNYSKSRVKVSPYRRSGRLAYQPDQTNTSLLANYTGNNTTMEMDITETSSSFIEEPNLDDSSYLRGLRSIRGRSSYKPLKEITLKHVANRSVRSTTSATSTTISSIAEPNRPTGTVVGRKRKPDLSEGVEGSAEVSSEGAPLPTGHAKRMRVLDRLAEPFRRAAVSLPTLNRRNADIVGINTDLPLSAPVVTDTFDPESLKSSVQQEPIAVPLPTREQHDSKRCILM